MISLICLGSSLLALVFALCELHDQRVRHHLEVLHWEAQVGCIPEQLGGTPWTRRQAV